MNQKKLSEQERINVFSEHLSLSQLTLVISEGDIGGFRTPQYRKKIRQIPQYRRKNR